MDEYGQIIECNWPREWFADANQFSERSDIQKTALNWAKKNLIVNLKYEIDLDFNKGHNAICWVFKFPTSKTSNSKSFKVIEIDWRTNKIIDKYLIKQITNH